MLPETVTPAEAVTVTEVRFEGRASSEGPLLETSLEKQAASKPHEKPFGLVKPILEPASGAMALEEPITVPNAQLVVIKEEQPI